MVSGATNPEAILIPEILVDSQGNYSIPKTSALNHDVTGGMLGKLECGRDIAMGGVPVYLTKAGSEEMLQICQGTHFFPVYETANYRIVFDDLLVFTFVFGSESQRLSKIDSTV